MRRPPQLITLLITESMRLSPTAWVRMVDIIIIIIKLGLRGRIKTSTLKMIAYECVCLYECRSQALAAKSGRGEKTTWKEE